VVCVIQDDKAKKNGHNWCDASGKSVLRQAALLCASLNLIVSFSITSGHFSFASHQDQRCAGIPIDAVVLFAANDVMCLRRPCVMRLFGPIWDDASGAHCIGPTQRIGSCCYYVIHCNIDPLMTRAPKNGIDPRAGLVCNALGFSPAPVAMPHQF
jgi:hypothetical protein